MPTDDASCAAPTSSRLPEDRAPSVCGTQWQEDYAALHARLVASPSSSRILVFDCRAARQNGEQQRRHHARQPVRKATLARRRAAVEHEDF